ncbi:hypothetical protein F7731_15990 [Cytobacillus depressus]|uniref:Uncharacterized protein n=1 Tax=Cytobacillus depressus TaxID=1602942 RepID=A0A6L3V4V6_9BACI|nr:hypothetical protein F7731_15990 [Cytobacillus depressus]
MSNVPLNDEGIRQAINLLNRLSEDKSWDMIITSDISSFPILN